MNENKCLLRYNLFCQVSCLPGLSPYSTCLCCRLLFCEVYEAEAGVSRLVGWQAGNKLAGW